MIRNFGDLTVNIVATADKVQIIKILGTDLIATDLDSVVKVLEKAPKDRVHLVLIEENGRERFAIGVLESSDRPRNDVPGHRILGLCKPSSFASAAVMEKAGIFF